MYSQIPKLFNVVCCPVVKNLDLEYFWDLPLAGLMIYVLFITCKISNTPYKALCGLYDKFIVLETSHQAVTAQFSTDCEGSNTSEFLGSRITGYLWVSGFTFPK